MKQTIILFEMITGYDVLNVFNRQLSETFAELDLDLDVVLINTNDEHNQQKLFHILDTHNIFAIVTLNGFFLDFAYSNLEFFNSRKIPIFTILVDNPIYHINRIKGLTNDTIIACVAEEHIDYLQHILQVKNPIYFLPHGAVKLDNNLPLPISERQTDILFAGSFFNPNEILNQINMLPSQLRNPLLTLIEYGLNCKNLNLLELTKEVFNKTHIPDSYLYSEIWWSALSLADTYIRSVHRVNFIESLTDLSNDYKIKLYGEGWEHSNINFKKIDLRGSAHFDIIYNEMKTSKVVATILTSFQRGLHERILTAMYNGSVNLFHQNEYTKIIMPSDKYLISYNPLQIDLNKIKRYLEDNHLLQQMADESYKLVTDQHLWHHRALSIANFINLHRAFTQKSD